MTQTEIVFAIIGANVVGWAIGLLIGNGIGWYLYGRNK